MVVEAGMLTQRLTVGSECITKSGNPFSSVRAGYETGGCRLRVPTRHVGATRIKGRKRNDLCGNSKVPGRFSKEFAVSFDRFKTHVNALPQNKSLNEQAAEVSHGKNASQRVPRCQ